MKDYTIKRIRKMRFERVMGVEQIAAKTGYCTNTIYKYLKDNFESPEEKEQKEYIGIAAPYEPIIREWLTEDKKHFYKQRHTAKRVYDRLREIEPSLSISYKTILRMYNRIHREVFSDRRERLNLPNSPGAVEIICTATKLRIHKKNCNSHVVTLSFPYSRAAFIQVIPDCNSEWVLTAIQNIYEHIGGVPPVQLFTPQTKLYKYRVHDIASLEDELFQRFILYYDFKDNYFIPSKEDELRLSGHSLGSYYRKQLMDGVKNIDDLAAFNKELLIKCDSLGERSTTLDKTKTVNELFDADKNNLLPLPEIPFKIITWFKRKVDNMAMLTIGGNHKYALSPGMKCRTVFVFLTTDKVEVRNLNQDIICTFERIYSSSIEDIINPIHQLYLLRSKPNAVLNCKIKELFPPALIEKFSDSKFSSKRYCYINAMWEIAKRANLETAIECAADAAMLDITKPKEIIKLYEDKYDAQRNN